MEAGRMSWEMEDIDPKQAIEEALGATSALFAGDDITLEVNLPPHLPRVHVDRDRLIQVLVNLLSNAAKFTEGPDRRVSVGVYTLPSAMEISVADNGPGIPRKDQVRIFEKFQQVGESLSGKPYGSGLGLPISRQIVEHFGGRLWVDSRPGHGAAFRFVLPLARAERPPGRRFGTGE